MTQAYSRPIVYLRLTPMQLPIGQPEAGNQASWSLEGIEAVDLTQLRLSPEEPSEMLVQVNNTSDRALRLSIQVTGDFPRNWCRIGTEGNVLPARQGMDAVLYFSLPDDFFESNQALKPFQALKLNYHGCIQVYQLPDEGNHGTLISRHDFRLYVRPHSLYPGFLPELYREVDFIGRFLKIFEQSFEPSVNTFQSLWAHLDPLTAPETLLPFLAQWVGWPSDIHWSPQQQRRLIRRAIEIYRWRGTKKGLQLYLHLYTGLPDRAPYIQIEESFTRGFVLGGTALGETAIVGGGKPFHFTVRLRRSSAPLDENLLRNIINQEKPAFCTYDLIVEEPTTG